MDENNNNNNTFKSIDSTNFNSSYREFKNSEKKFNFGFTRNVLAPFLFGVIGSITVLAVSLNVPSIKENLVKKLVTIETPNAYGESINNEKNAIDSDDAQTNVTNGVKKEVSTAQEQRQSYLDALAGNN